MQEGGIILLAHLHINIFTVVTSIKKLFTTLFYVSLLIHMLHQLYHGY